MDLIPAQYYYDVYLVMVTLLSFSCLTFYNGRDVSLSLNVNQENKKAFRLFFIFAIFVGVRPISEYFADMTQYYGIYTRWSGSFTFNWDVENLLYDNQMMWFANIRLEPVIYYLYIAFIYFGGMYVACRKMFPGNAYAALLVCLVAFSTFGAGTNGIKAGSAASLFLIALAYRDNLKICIPFVLLSYGFHHSMQVPIAAMVATLFYNKKPKYYIYFWIFCFILSALHISYFQLLFAGLTDDKGAGYLLSDRSEDVIFDRGGFRLDFIIYSAMPILMGWYAITKRKIQDKWYNIIFCTYTLVNAVWMLCMYASFTNRIAYLSWFMYPIVLIYPLFLEQWGNDRYKFFAKVAALHLAFTLFMHIVYY
ncbi:EpsG family protein [uncultured Bacteroides sp.]|uniref:EpsG family protein n=1 Tax=uncultured Bacteroides sp. TaxID=162156 RepID=UPI00033589E2|nr:EpsG family protein [uncultured Bacteroides sp.]CDA84111.1 uncharacterized protein BN772_02555 [Bacteroides sp. CAG:754]